MTLCIGGKFHGAKAPNDDRSVLMRKHEPLGTSAFDYDPMLTPDKVTTTDIVQVYTRRLVMSGGRKIEYYAPENWSDEEALRFALT